MHNYENVDSKKKDQYTILIRFNLGKIMKNNVN